MYASFATTTAALAGGIARVASPREVLPRKGMNLDGLRGPPGVLTTAEAEASTMAFPLNRKRKAGYGLHDEDDDEEPREDEVEGGPQKRMRKSPYEDQVKETIRMRLKNGPERRPWLWLYGVSARKRLPRTPWDDKVLARRLAEFYGPPPVPKPLATSNPIEAQATAPSLPKMTIPKSTATPELAPSTAAPTFSTSTTSSFVGFQVPTIASALPTLMNFGASNVKESVTTAPTGPQSSLAAVGNPAQQVNEFASGSNQTPTASGTSVPSTPNAPFNFGQTFSFNNSSSINPPPLASGSNHIPTTFGTSVTITPLVTSKPIESHNITASPPKMTIPNLAVPLMSPPNLDFRSLSSTEGTSTKTYQPFTLSTNLASASSAAPALSTSASSFVGFQVPTTTSAAPTSMNFGVSNVKESVTTAPTGPQSSLAAVGNPAQPVNEFASGSNQTPTTSGASVPSTPNAPFSFGQSFSFNSSSTTNPPPLAPGSNQTSTTSGTSVPSTPNAPFTFSQAFSFNSSSSLNPPPLVFGQLVPPPSTQAVSATAAAPSTPIFSFGQAPQQPGAHSNNSADAGNQQPAFTFGQAPVGYVNGHSSNTQPPFAFLQQQQPSPAGLTPFGQVSSQSLGASAAAPTPQSILVQPPQQQAIGGIPQVGPGAGGIGAPLGAVFQFGDMSSTDTGSMFNVGASRKIAGVRGSLSAKRGGSGKKFKRI
ncbi:hypothetical protein SeMB42_g01472 [Synchytrium endobioticum]|uniref:Uncharacterized protein n=1 Tax=Synchytrium endobioticum TaxID=286115 RepID=A0A507DDY7_9FUNG|nr:hypothetical protein SeLEV6574_g01201 [Synchytrium endobioticum]TPX52363.1 hypothetical protein SeMB42_g01472 [Synchytrium endobioticum]